MAEQKQDILWKAILEPKDGYERLRRQLFGERVPSGESVMESIRKGFVPVFLTDEDRTKIDRAIETLDKREAEIIRLHSGINCEPKTLREIVNLLGLSRERIRQIEAKALCRLRHPKRGITQIIFYWEQFCERTVSLENQVRELNLSLATETERRMVEEAKLKQFRNAVFMLQPLFDLLQEAKDEEATFKTASVLQDRQRISKLLKMRVDELELTVRMANCLWCMRIETLAALVQKSKAEMLKHRNFGQKSLNALNEILEELGLRFGMDISPYLEEGL